MDRRPKVDNDLAVLLADRELNRALVRLRKLPFGEVAKRAPESGRVQKVAHQLVALDLTGRVFRGAVERL